MRFILFAFVIFAAIFAQISQQAYVQAGNQPAFDKEKDKDTTPVKKSPLSYRDAAAWTFSDNDKKQY